jgi:hypothetical protein
MTSLINLKTTTDDFEVEFEIIPPVDILSETDPRQQKINKAKKQIENKLQLNDNKIEELNKEIDRLTNHADGIDYMVAVGSGILAGLVDSFWVGEFSLDRGKAWGSDKVNSLVKNIAKKTGYKGNDLAGSIEFLEGKYGAPSDSVTSELGGGLQHHLRDFAHHPTPVGLVFSMLTQFTGKAYGTDTSGAFKIVNVTNKLLIGKNVPQKFLFGTIFWFFHMISDMAGSSANASAGTGLPGPILSLLKEISSLPFFKKNDADNKEFSVWISKLFNGTLLAICDEAGKIIKPMRFDLRAELGVVHELGRQALPVILNECIVRGFYFIRRFVQEIKEKKIKQPSDLNLIEWKNCLPWKNRTIIRMLTISTGTFTACDLIDAAIRGGIKSGGNPALFAKEFILRVNFVGVGSFAVAVYSDVKMGIKRSSLRNKRIAIYNEQLHLANAKIFYMQAETWIAAEETEQTIREVFEMMDKTIILFVQSLKDIEDSINKIGDNVNRIEKKDPKFINEIRETLKWG